MFSSNWQKWTSIVIFLENKTRNRIQTKLGGETKKKKNTFLTYWQWKLCFAFFSRFNSCTQYNSLKTWTHRAEDVTVSWGAAVLQGGATWSCCQISTGTDGVGGQDLGAGTTNQNGRQYKTNKQSFSFLFFFCFLNPPIRSR